MKNDLDSLMAQHNLDAILVSGPAQHNPAMYYFTGGGHITFADLVKARGKEAILYHGPMERDEAAKTGLTTRSYSLYPMKEFLEEAGGDRWNANALRYRKMLADAGVTRGRMALYGLVELGNAYPLFAALQKVAPEIQLDGNASSDVLSAAMATKEAGEIEKIRRMGVITTQVVQRVADYLTSRRVRDEVLYGDDDQPITVGKIKSLINLWLIEAGAENPEGTIFAIGRDAGVPHSSGNPADILRLGQTIVFDIFPCEAGGGYHYDFTRTWCLGYAPDAALKLYEQVYEVYQKVTALLKADQPFAEAQKLTCELFEGMGHKTIMSTPTTEEGYVHSIGHGLGLKVHELPFSRLNESGDHLVPGSVFTIEPGLYYPEQGMGVRLEDTYAVTAAGEVEKLVDYPFDLVLRMR